METIEGYDVVEKIGEGGMGQVYRAVHRRLDRPVAIKRLAPHLSHNQDMLKRFLQEARLQARLTHPNVVNIFDLIENDKGIFLVMEYVEGQTARDMLQERGRLSASEALMIAEGVLSGLAFMHKNGVVHRDIKPSNVMVSADGTVKVTDFGIARLVNEETGLTRFGAGIGTLHYMAPELIKSGQVSFAIDIYSLGATLHELLAGAPPFVGNTDLEIMMGHLEKEPPRIDYLPRDEAGKACQKLIETALAKAPQDRFASAAAFLDEVRRVREMLPPLAGPQTAPAESGRPVPPGIDAPTGAAPIDVPSPPPQAKRDAADDKATSPAPVVPPPDQASSLTRGAPEARAPAGKESAPPIGSPKKGRLGLVAGLGAAAVVAVVLFLVLRPGPTPPVPAPAKTAVQVQTPQGGPSEKKAEPAAPAPAAETPPASPAPVVSQTPEAEKPAEPAPQMPVSPTPEDALPAASRKAAGEPEASSAVPVAETPGPAGSSPSPAVGAAPEAEKAAESSPQAPEAGVPSSDAGAPSTPTVSQASESEKPIASAPGTPPEKREVYVGQAGARMREQPDTSSKILLTLDPGTRLVVIEDTGEWIKASEPDGQVGYISEKQTSAAPPAPSKVPPRPAKPASRKPAQKPAGDDQPGWRIVK